MRDLAPRAPALRPLLFVACLSLAACSGDGKPEARDEPPARATPVPDYRCTNQEAVIEDASLRTGEPEAGDVDGDGIEERVWVHFDPQGEPGCQAFVVARSPEGGTLSGPLETWRSEFGLPMPVLDGLYEIDDRPGLEVVVHTGAGASTQFVGVVVSDGGALSQVRSRIAGTNGDGMFGFGGSVGHVEAVDCAPGGGIVLSFATPDGDVYRVERRSFRFAGAALVPDGREIERVPLEELHQFREYDASPFGSCS